MKVGVFYFTTSGNTEEMARAFADGVEAAGAELVYNQVSEADSDEVASCDAFALGSPAQGTEEMDESEFMPFYDDNKSAFEGKKVFLFGSYGWGGGEYMETFADQAREDGLDVVEIYTFNETPDPSALDELKEKGEAFAK
ncbi:MAG: flavodoxin domain-containing protein [Eubacteriales bacterium]|nr:flavodoxin domain-containing protein [Eubacteriales bacterium]